MIDRYRVRLLIGGAVSLPLFFLPFTPEDPFLVPKQALLSFLACFALIILLYPVETLLRDSSRALLLSSLFLLVCIAISIPGSSNKYAGLTELIRWSYLLIIFFTAIRIDWGLRRLRNFMKMTILISALVAISALLEYFRLVPFYLYPFRGGRTLYSFFGYPNIMAQYLIVTIFWGIAILVSSETKKIRAIALICTMLSVSALLVTFSRGAIISTIMSGLFFSFLYLKIKSNVNVSAKKIIFIVGFLIIACTTSILLSDSASDGKTLIQIKDMFKRGDSYRIMLWSKSFNTFSVTPVTGIGLGNYRFARHIYAHNDVIQLIVETGTVGLGGFLVFIFFLFKKIQRQYAGVTDRERKVLHLGIASGLLATLMHSMVSFNLHSATSSFFFFLSAGILCSQKLTSDRGSQSQSTSIKKNGIALLVTVSLSLLAMYGEYRSVMSHFYFSQAIYYQKRKEVSRSLEYSLKAIQYQPYNAKYLRYAGNMYRRTGQIALAKDYFKKAKLLSLYK